MIERQPKWDRITFGAIDSGLSSAELQTLVSRARAYRVHRVYVGQGDYDVLAASIDPGTSPEIGILFGSPFGGLTAQTMADGLCRAKEAGRTLVATTLPVIQSLTEDVSRMQGYLAVMATSGAIPLIIADLAVGSMTFPAALHTVRLCLEAGITRFCLGTGSKLDRTEPEQVAYLTRKLKDLGLKESGYLLEAAYAGSSWEEIARYLAAGAHTVRACGYQSIMELTAGFDEIPGTRG